MEGPGPYVQHLSQIGSILDHLRHERVVVLLLDGELRTFNCQFLFVFWQLPARFRRPSSSASAKVSQLKSLGFREARFEKLEIEKLHFEAGSFVLELLSF